MKNILFHLEKNKVLNYKRKTGNQKSALQLDIELKPNLIHTLFYTVFSTNNLIIIWFLLIRKQNSYY